MQDRFSPLTGAGFIISFFLYGNELLSLLHGTEWKKSNDTKRRWFFDAFFFKALAIGIRSNRMHERDLLKNIDR